MDQTRSPGSLPASILPDSGFQAVFQSLPDLYLVLVADSPRFTIAAVSDAYASATMTRREEIVGRGLFEVFPDNPDDPNATGTQNLRASLEQVIAKRAPDEMALQKYDVRRPAQDGGGFEERWWSPISFPVVGPSGDLAYIVHRVEDVTEFIRLDPSDADGGEVASDREAHTEKLESTSFRWATGKLKEREALMQAVVDTAVDAIITIDARGKILSFNRSAERLLGYRAAEVIGRNVSMLMPSPHSEDHDSYLASYRDTGVKKIIGIGREVTARRKDGTVVPVHLSVNEVKLPRRRLFTGFLRDLSERRKLESEYLQAQKMEAIGRLAGGVAHDFNNLLASILGGLRIATEGIEEGHPSLPMLREVGDEATRGAAIARRLLDFSRTKAPEPRPLDPVDTVRAAERMIRRLLGEDIAVRIECTSDGAPVVADPQMIEQALLNLAINARDAMPRGGELAIECRTADVSAQEAARFGPDARPGSYVVLSVEDTGCGMDEATLMRAKEAFFTTKDPGLGTGLGLSTVESMMRIWGGYFVLESSVGVGTKARLFFPRARAVLPSSTPEERAPESADSGGGETILLVEDEKLVRIGTQHLLERDGYVVFGAKDPDEALEVLRAQGARIDLLLTDVILPGMSGPELYAVAKELLPALPALFMSAFPKDELVARGRITAGTLALEKPFSAEDLKAKVRAALARSPEAG